MLITCPECNLQVSDKAYTCPHCGYPMKSKPKTQISTRRRRLPNGFGRITKLTKPGLRKPYRAMVTTGMDPNGNYIGKLLKPEAYFATYNEAYEALVEYNKNPYELDSSISVLDLYTKWSEYYFESLKSDSSKRTIVSAWRYCSSVYNMRAKDLRARHIKGCIDNGTANINGELRTASPETKSRIKSLFNLMMDYALEYEIVDKNYSRTFSISDDIINEIEESKRPHMAFTDSEFEKLWKNVDNIKNVDLVLIQSYMGWRPQELGLIEISNVDLENWLIRGGMKTQAGIMRVVPVHPKIRPFIEKKYNEAVELGSKYLLNCTDTKTHRGSLKLTYDKYAGRFNKVCELLSLNPEHRAHDPRKHFVTMCKKYKLDEYAIKYMVGHRIDDITEKVYTEREVSWLAEELLKIP